MGYAQDLVQAGYSGYAGWGDNEAKANFKATQGAGKYAQGGGGTTGGGTQVNNFDFAAEAQKAYGELGLYYDRLLKESQGDTTKVLARLTEDYDTGLRNQTQDTQATQAGYDRAQTEADRQAGLGRENLVSSAVGRGIYQKSAYGPANDQANGRGIFDTNLLNFNTGVNAATNERNIAKTKSGDLLTRWTQGAKTTLSRNTEDANLKQTRYAAELQRNRAIEAAQLSNMRGQGGADYLKYMSNPSLT